MLRSISRMQMPFYPKVQNLSKGGFELLQVLEPPHGVIVGYNSEVTAIFKGILGRTFEPRRLTSLRDTLLPKLLSGELRVPDAEKMVEQAV